MSDDLQLKVDASMHGTRIDRLLAERFPEITRSRFQKLLRDGHVTARGRKVRSAYRVLEGDDLHIHVPAPDPVDLEPEDIPLNIVHDDEHIVVVDKPPGLVVHPAAGNRTGTLVHALLFRFPAMAEAGEEARPGIVHRLDKDTSGLMVVAKTPRAHAALADAIKKRDVKREYAALVWGRMRRPAGTIQAAIGRHPVDRKKMSIVTRRARAAVTHFRVVESFAYTTLLDVQLDTGRTHQIRVHMAHQGNPVFGDVTYGGRNSRLTRLPAGLRVEARKALKLLSRQALHAKRLSFRHPVTGLEMVFESSLPEDFSEILAMMRRPAPGVRR